MANEGFGTLLLNEVEDFPISVQPFAQGAVAVPSVQPFDMVGDPVSVASEQPFWMEGLVAVPSVQPFWMGSLIAVSSHQPFDMLASSDFSYPPTDIGDGDLNPSTAQPVYGWWSGADDENESLGPMETD